MSACTLFCVLLLTVRSVSVTAAVNRSWQLKTYWVHASEIRTLLPVWPHTKSRCGEFAHCTGKEHWFIFNLSLLCCCPRDQKQLLHLVTHQVSNDEECVYTVYDMSSCFATTFITYYVSLLLHVLKHKISKNVFLQKYTHIFSTNTTF